MSHLQYRSGIMEVLLGEEVGQLEKCFMGLQKFRVERQMGDSFSIVLDTSIECDILLPTSFLTDSLIRSLLSFEKSRNHRKDIRTRGLILIKLDSVFRLVRHLGVSTHEF